MDIEDLKKVWDQYSSTDKEKELDENAIEELLRGRTKSLMERIDRNIRIGFLIILALIVVFIVDDLVVSPLIINGISDGIKIPGWILILDIVTNLVIIATFIIFVSRYYRVKKSCNLACDLADSLKKIIHILNIYKRLFYFAIFILLFSTTTGFIAGLYKGVVYSAQLKGIAVNEIQPGDIIITIFMGLLVLLLISFGLFLLFRWGFRRLYGNYLTKLKLTLKELNEIE
jgi:hypothetical protein